MSNRILILLLAVALTACGTEPTQPAGDPVDAPIVHEPVPESPQGGDRVFVHPRVANAFSEGARAALHAPEHVTLHAIDPSAWRDYGYGRNTEPTPLAHALAALKAKRGVLGSLPVEVEARRSITKSVYAGLIESGPVAGCYEPRHALVYEQGETTVVVCICFQCHYLVALEAGTAKGRYTSLQDPDGLKGRLNAMLAEAGIKPAK